MRRTIQFLGQPRAPRRVAPAAKRGPKRKAHIPAEVSVLTRIRDQCIQARCTVGGSTPSVYYRGCPILQHSTAPVVAVVIKRKRWPCWPLYGRSPDVRSGKPPTASKCNEGNPFMPTCQHGNINAGIPFPRHFQCFMARFSILVKRRVA